jgi:predicted nucleotidyltransferase
MCFIREGILDVLERNRARLQELGARNLAVFGSATRGELGPASDVDLLVDLDPKSFDVDMDLKFFLEDILGRRVDLVLRDSIKPMLRKPIISSALNVSGY